MNKQDNSIHVLNLSNYTSPKITENKKKDWVEYGEDNNYFGYIIDRYTGSTTNNASINNIVKLIYGRGLDATDSSRKASKYAEMRKLLNPDCIYNTANDLKLLGGYAIQVVYDTNRNINEAIHFPFETLRPEIAKEDGEIEAWYYFHDWAKIKPNDKPKRIPSFGKSKEGVEILVMRPYRSGYFYFTPVDYQGGLQYAELEEEVSNYHINNIKNGMSPSMLINFNNGSPSEEDRKKIVKDINNKYSGSSNAGRAIVAFNKDKDKAATIDAVQLSDAHNQYQFLSTECTQKIMLSHQITSPMLLGIKDNTGLGNNTDELRTGFIIFNNMVIKPFQDFLIEGYDKILNHNDIVLNLYFKTLQPLEFTDMGDNIIDQDTREEETGVKLSSDKNGFVAGKSLIDLADDEMNGWELVDEMDVDYDLEDDLDKELNKLNNAKKSKFSKIFNFVTSGRARPNISSEQDQAIDGVTYKVRYRYSPLKVSDNSRDFCKNMVRVNKLYRKEDIIAMENQAVNPGWGPNGSNTYSIWLYKGGGDCHHKWRRETYKYTGEGQGSIGRSEEVSTNQSERDGFRVRNPKEVSVKPKDMPYNGYLPTNKRFQ